MTEDAAEAVALAWVNVSRGWTEVRRLEQGQFGDWLLVDEAGQQVALEVSGIAGGYSGSRLREKLAQVARSEYPVKVACVVAFGPPTAVLEMVG